MLGIVLGLLHLANREAECSIRIFGQPCTYLKTQFLVLLALAVGGLSVGSKDVVDNIRKNEEEFVPSSNFSIAFHTA